MQVTSAGTHPANIQTEYYVIEFIYWKLFGFFLFNCNESQLPQNKIYVLGANGFRCNWVCLNQRCASHVGDAPTIKPFVSLDSPVGLRQTVSVLAWNTIKENRFPVWCQDTCNSISTKPNLPETKIKPVWGRAFPSSFSVFDHRPASSNAARQSDGFIDSFRIKTSTKTIRAFLFWGLYQAEVHVHQREILRPSPEFDGMLHLAV